MGGGVVASGQRSRSTRARGRARSLITSCAKSGAATQEPWRAAYPPIICDSPTIADRRPRRGLHDRSGVVGAREHPHWQLAKHGIEPKGLQSEALRFSQRPPRAPPGSAAPIYPPGGRPGRSSPLEVQQPTARRRLPSSLLGGQVGCALYSQWTRRVQAASQGTPLPQGFQPRPHVGCLPVQGRCPRGSGLRRS